VLHRRDPHPDSSRYWYADDYEARFARGEEPRGLDKEYVRRTLADRGYRGDGPPPLATRSACEAARRYMALAELITGKPFVPDTEDPRPASRATWAPESAAALRPDSGLRRERSGSRGVCPGSRLGELLLLLGRGQRHRTLHHGLHLGGVARAVGGGAHVAEVDGQGKTIVDAASPETSTSVW
jgi:hypothetical protein